MVDFIRLQETIKHKLDADRSIKNIEATAPTLKEAVTQAAALLNIPISKMEYQVSEKGANGFLGFGRKAWTIRAYPSQNILVQGMELEDDGLSLDSGFGFDTSTLNSQDGDCFVRLWSDGVYLKVTPPIGNGREVSTKDALNALEERNQQDYDKELVGRIAQESEGIYIKVGVFQANEAVNAGVQISVIDQDMKATATLSSPGPNGCDLSEERLRNELAAYGINFGIDNNTVKEIIDTPVYKKAYVVAQGTWAQDGADAYINYDFETDTSKMRFRQSTDGTMNFKEMNLIQNVVQGQPLAKKIEAEQGKPGSTVFGKLLPAKNGKDIPMPLGKNVSVADDKVTIVADLNGQVVLQASKINVEPVLTINGNVNITTGNVIFLGTVVVTGNVEDGFYVKAEGNIEIRGTVERSEIEAEGNVIVQQGVTGKETGTIKAGKSVFARFIENCQVEAGDSVVVADGLVNSNVVALKRIICNGRKAHIVGGHLKATEEINAKTIGSPSGGTETICEVGFDPSSKARLDELTTENEKANAEMEQVKLNIQTLINMRKQRKSLPEDKETQLNEMMDRREELTKMLREYRDERNRIMEFLNGLKSVGKISASERIYPGVRLIIREIEQQVKDDYKSVTFVLRNNMIQAGRYEDVSDDIKKEMETNGATTD